jgi:hypothetical protein
MDHDDVGSHLVQKLRIKHMISDVSVLARVEHAVVVLHDVVQQGLAFGKLWAQSRLDAMLDQAGGVFSPTVATEMSAEFPINGLQIEEWMDIVSTDLNHRKGPPYAPARAARMARLHDFYTTQAAAGRFPTTKLACPNLSIPKGYAASQMAVNYATNVHCHYDAYVKRLVSVSLRRGAEHRYCVPPGQKLPPDARAELKADVRAVTHDILTTAAEPSCREGLRVWMRSTTPLLMPPPPQTVDPLRPWRFYSQKANPAIWLPYMLMMTRWTEDAGGKPLSPMPQRTSFVPCHIRIDTNGLLDLLIDDQAALELLKAQLEEMRMPDVGDSSGCGRGGGGGDGSSDAPTWNLSGMETKHSKTGKITLSKASLYGSLRSIVDPSLRSRIDRDPARHVSEFNTAVWRCLTKLGGNKHAGVEYRGLLFSNMIDTDGVAVSMHYVSNELRGVTRFNGGFAKLKAIKRDETAAEEARGARYITKMSEAERHGLMLQLRNSGAKLVSCDPGKGVLASVGDGKRSVRYTAAQRRVESGAARHKQQADGMLAQRCEGDVRGRTFSELARSIGGSRDAGDGQQQQQQQQRRCHQTCITARFCAYLEARRRVAEQLNTFYRRKVFRAHRYAAHCGRRSSEDKFVSRIRNEFGADAVIMWGDWGRSPNLKHQPPSPGIGLRRRVAASFLVLLVHEPYTSSVCPTCECTELLHPRRHRTKTVPLSRRGDPIHHLLKCSNPRCSGPWWQRDNLGRCNIHKTGLHALKTGSWHPMFRLRSRAAAA